MNTEGLIKGWMATAGLSLKELSDATGIKYSTLTLRIRHPEEFRARELNAIRRITHMTDIDFQKLCLAAGEGR